MQLSLAFSPCPNDTFIFDALVNQKIDTEGFEFSVVMEDVETLNLRALSHQYDISKISYGVYPQLLESYSILNSGSALGKGVGPLLISGSIEKELSLEDVVAVPGENTTAHFLFSRLFPQHKSKVFIRYNEIEDFVLQKKGLGVIIHENRFTYREKGLHLIKDLGQYWEQETALPIPLGGIVIKREIEKRVQQKVDKLIQLSIQNAFKEYPAFGDYIRCNAQEMNDEIIRKHIDLYVNHYSLNLASDGKNAILEMLRFLGIHQSEHMSFFV
jgi:1,4-dihydroxy-6-naphthoate synthase